VALALSGAPRLAVAVRTGALHVCQCRAHGDGHRCACPICAEQARRARRGAVEKLPPCHRQDALARLDAEEERERSAASLPVLKPLCGLDDAPAWLPATDIFFTPARAAPSPPRLAGRIAPGAGDTREAPAVPAVPPPIAA